jgi:DNA-binding XRE family transcriptional regulator
MTATFVRMPGHPNRSKTNVRAAANPSPAEIRRAREEAGLTLEQAGALVYTSWRTWQNWEAGKESPEHRRMHPATWELFLVKVQARRLLERGRIAPLALKDLGLQLPED